MRFTTEPGEAYQMDWGFVDALDPAGNERRMACFAMVCHHCGTCYVEFFPNARQENLFIGMVRGFVVPGVPRRVPTDNMRSVVVRRGADGRPVWQADYEAFVFGQVKVSEMVKGAFRFGKRKFSEMVRPTGRAPAPAPPTVRTSYR